jgi:hypothetical protein
MSEKSSANLALHILSLRHNAFRKRETVYWLDIYERSKNELASPKRLICENYSFESISFWERSRRKFVALNLGMSKRYGLPIIGSLFSTFEYVPHTVYIWLDHFCSSGALLPQCLDMYCLLAFQQSR